MLTESQINQLLADVKAFVRQQKSNNGWSIEITGKGKEIHLKQTAHQKISAS